MRWIWPSINYRMMGMEDAIQVERFAVQDGGARLHGDL